LSLSRSVFWILSKVYKKMKGHDEVSHVVASLTFYEGDDPQAGAPTGLPVEGATGCGQSVDDWRPLLLLAGVPAIGGVTW
jgi:hypothetical protein